jgi:hypothetical protein
MIQLLGYFASLLVIISLVMTSVLRLRLVGLLGAIAWFIYGLLIESPPVYITNAIIIGIDIYFLYQMLTARHYFRLLEVDRTSAFAKDFVAFYAEDIAHFFPGFEYAPDKADISYFVLRDMLPIGLFIAQRDSAHRTIVQLDYVIPGYRDLDAGKFLYKELDALLPAKGVHTLYSVPGLEAHQRYLLRMGFTPVREATTGGLYQRNMGIKHQ